MPYTVVYDPAAEDELSWIWIQAPDQQAVADASNDIDRRLKWTPEQAGDPHGEFRRLVVHPLEVVFKVSPDDRQVRVIQVTFVP